MTRCSLTQHARPSEKQLRIVRMTMARGSAAARATAMMVVVWPFTFGMPLMALMGHAAAVVVDAVTSSRGGLDGTLEMVQDM